MFRKLTRNRPWFAGLALTLGVAALGMTYNPAQARTSFGADRVARAESLAAALAAFTEAAKTCDLDETREAFEAAESVWNAVEIDIQFASVERYNFFEHVYLEDRVARGTGLEGDPAESCENMVALARADVALTNAVTAYVEAPTPTTAKALQDQIDVAEQAFVGQYWGTPALVEFLDSL